MIRNGILNTKKAGDHYEDGLSLPASRVLEEFFTPKEDLPDDVKLLNDFQTHFVGSFNFSFRRGGADGKTGIICVYDSKTVRSMSDGRFKDSDNNKGGPLSTTYQRYIWTIKLK